MQAADADYYRLLGISSNATADEIAAAYRRCARQHHPDKGGDSRIMQQLNRAKDRLTDPQLRAAYDAARSDEDLEADLAARGDDVPRLPAGHSCADIFRGMLRDLERTTADPGFRLVDPRQAVRSKAAELNRTRLGWLKVGESVEYRGRARPAIVKAIHTDDPSTLYCTISFGGAERQTTADRLCKLGGRFSGRSCVSRANSAEELSHVLRVSHVPAELDGALALQVGVEQDGHVHVLITDGVSRLLDPFYPQVRVPVASVTSFADALEESLVSAASPAPFRPTNRRARPPHPDARATVGVCV